MGGGVQQVPTQGIANLVERWSCIVLGEHIVEEPNHIHFCVPSQYNRTNSLQDRS